MPDQNASQTTTEAEGSDIGSQPVDAPISGGTVLTPKETQPGGRSDTQPGGDTVSGGDTATGGEEGDDEKTSDDDKKSSEKKEGAPEEYEAFKLPENVEINEALLTEATSVFKDLGLSQEQAQKLIDLDLQRQEREAQEDQTAHDEQVAEWAKAAKADKEIGGDKFEATAADAVAVVNAFGNDEFKAILNATGLGNHPEMIRFAAKIKQHLGNDVFEEASGNSGQQRDVPLEKRIFSNLE